MPNAASAASTDTASIERWTLIATILASSMAFIDSSALNVALPVIQKDLNATASQGFWIANGYLLFLAALILVGGSLGDLYGRNRIFMIGVIVFTLSSLACGLAPDVNVLILARAVQGIGGALMVPGSLAILSAIFAPERRGTAIGTWSSFSTVTTIAGPLVGGYLVQSGLWRAVFLINVPFAAAVLYALLHVPETRDGNAKRLDVPGAVLATLGLAGVTFGLLQGPELGFNDPLILGALIGGVVALVVFFIWEGRTESPMVPLSLFKSRTFSGTNALTLFLYGALSGAFLFVSLNLIQVQGYDPFYAGLASMPFTIMLIILSRRMGGLVDKIGPRIPLTLGPLITGIGFFLYSRIGLTNGVNDYWTTFFLPSLVGGIGMGILVAPLTTAVMGSAPQGSTGIASGINNAVARTGGVLAIAIFGALGVLTFTSALSARTAAMELPDDVRQSFMAEEAPKLGEAQPLEGMEAGVADQLETAIRESFVDVYRLILSISAGMAFLSAALAWVLVESRLNTPEKTEN